MIQIFFNFVRLGNICTQPLMSMTQIVAISLISAIYPLMWAFYVLFFIEQMHFIIIITTYGLNCEHGLSQESLLDQSYHD